MNLFEIKKEILSCTCVDPETCVESIDTEKLAALRADSGEIIEKLACWVRNIESDATALKERKMMFAKRQQTAWSWCWMNSASSRRSRGSLR